MLKCHGSLAVFLLLVTTSWATEPDFPLVVLAKTQHDSDRYCALYCVHEAGRITGHAVDLNWLIRPERVAGRYGSTVQDVLEVCGHFGISTHHSPATLYPDLMLHDGPAIVLIKNEPGAVEPSHWILVIRADGNNAEVFDPGVGVVTISAAELMALWDGVAVVIHHDADAAWAGPVWAVARLFIVALVIAWTALLLRSLTRFRPTVALATGVLATISLVHGLNPTGFLQNRELVGEIVATQRPRTLDAVSPEEAIALRQLPNVVVIDTRTRPQYVHARIPNAVSIPYVGPYLHKKQEVSKLSVDSHLILYCETPQFPWSEALGSGPLFRHFARVSVLDGGLQEYVAAKGPLTRGEPGQAQP